MDGTIGTHSSWEIRTWGWKMLCGGDATSRAERFFLTDSWKGYCVFVFVKPGADHHVDQYVHYTQCVHIQDLSYSHTIWTIDFALFGPFCLLSVTQVNKYRGEGTLHHQLFGSHYCMCHIFKGLFKWEKSIFKSILFWVCNSTKWEYGRPPSTLMNLNTAFFCILLLVYTITSSVS